MNLKQLRKHFVSGIFVLTPFIVILWILVALVRGLWGLQHFLPDPWRPDQLLTNPFLILLLKAVFTILATFILIIGISIVGWLSRQLLGKKILEFIADGIIQKIPVLRSIYSALDQLLKTMASSSGNQFNRVVYVEYPRKNMWTLAFVTSEAKTSVLPGGYLNLFIPTTPNPTSGFYLLVSESEVKDSKMSVEEAFKTILSLGIAQTNQTEPTDV